MREIIPETVIRNILDIVSNSKNQTKKEVRKGQHAQEEDITKAFITQIERLINEEYNGEGIKVTHITLPKTDEKYLGADIYISMKIKKNGFERKKGVLFQAKRGFSHFSNNPQNHTAVGIDKVTSNLIVKCSGAIKGNYRDLYEQCERMTDISDWSQILVYSEYCFYCTSAKEFLGLQEPNDIKKGKPEEVHLKTLSIEVWFDFDRGWLWGYPTCKLLGWYKLSKAKF